MCVPLGANALADWVVQGATTLHKLVAPLMILVVRDNRTIANFEPCYFYGSNLCRTWLLLVQSYMYMSTHCRKMGKLTYNLKIKLLFAFKSC